MADLSSSHGRAYIPIHDGRVAILDTSENAAKVVEKLKDKNIKVIARYYAREPQPPLPDKRVAFNKIGDSLESKILTDNGIAILSVYQYKNQLPEKFITGLPDMGSAADEAKADARAALDQAKIVGQPYGSAIYFGVDFDVRDGTKDQNGKLVIESILDHFKIVKQTIGDKYRVGAYANGYVNRVLRDEGLIVFSWVSPSRSFAETPAYISSGQWHLFQNKVDRRWFGTAGKCPSGLGVDTNVQNPAYPYIGAWGGEAVAPERTKTIFDQRRFALKATVVYSAKNDNGLPIAKERCLLRKKWKWEPEDIIQPASNVRVLSDDGTWVQVDINDDGEADGYCLTASLTKDFRTMPVL